VRSGLGTGTTTSWDQPNCSEKLHRLKTNLVWFIKVRGRERNMAFLNKNGVTQRPSTFTTTQPHRIFPGKDKSKSKETKLVLGGSIITLENEFTEESKSLKIPHFSRPFVIKGVGC